MQVLTFPQKTFEKGLVERLTFGHDGLDSSVIAAFVKRFEREGYRLSHSYFFLQCYV